MLRFDHITVIAPTLAEGVAHVRDCLDLEVPFGTRHDFMGTHNHRLQLGDRTYLEIVALDPDGVSPGRVRWFGVDDPETVRADWDEGRRLRGWVAATAPIEDVVSKHPLFGDVVPLPAGNPLFAFSIPEDGSLPLDGAAPSLIDRRGSPTSFAGIPNLGAHLKSLTMEHPDPAVIETLYRDLAIDRPPVVIKGPGIRYRAEIETPAGLKVLT